MKGFSFCFSIVIFPLFSTLAQALPNCEEAQLKKFLQMDYKAFDQSPPKGGWRALENLGEDLEIARIIEGYANCRPGLTPEQKATLVFHAGQIYADLGKNDLALEKMRRAYDENLNKKYHWNSYVDGSIAFLKKDLEKLKAARDKVQTAEPHHPYVGTLNDMIQCFKRPYKEFEKCRNEKTVPASK